MPARAPLTHPRGRPWLLSFRSTRHISRPSGLRRCSTVRCQSIQLQSYRWTDWQRRRQRLSVRLVRLHFAFPTHAQDYANYFLGRRFDVLLLDHPCLSWLLSAHLGLHRLARHAWRSRRVLLGRLYSSECGQGHHSLGEFDSGRQHCCTLRRGLQDRLASSIC